MTENYIQYIPVFEKKPDMREILINRRNQKKIGTRNIKEKNFLYQISGSLNISYSFTPAY
ncbi:hypothetical protein PFNF135_05563 [Plasmodium falciparum NF135/5.C10]|uniref:Uncharacterized protein n=1 Tax=Plasmodium falciparum NF135/5.C10 TaxID=1036726 RepID=W4I744_PLAFA|nr:hypothetical protein PFNF135_05563 [Plasmodium falciparum NF135/5.C10]